MSRTQRITVTGLLSLLVACTALMRAAEARDKIAPPAPVPGPAPQQIDVCFVLDTTGSMSGLIEGAKRKIWSIANTLVAPKPAPKVRFGLIGYRDRGDTYVTKVYDLSEDLDAIYDHLRGFRAGGGGDGPESVNQALHEAVTRMSWNRDRNVLKIIFLVGDAPPHMDYANDVHYPKTCELAVRNDLIINTIQCGNNSATKNIWRDICRRAEGEYVALGQTGNMVTIHTPYDQDIAKLNRELGQTRVYYGQADKRAKAEAVQAVNDAAPAAAAADRAAFLNKLGRASTSPSAPTAPGASIAEADGIDLVEAAEGKNFKVEDLDSRKLPRHLARMTPAQRTTYLKAQAKKRAELSAKIGELVKKRNAHIAQERRRLAASGPKADSFDERVTDIIKAQARRRR